jgi:hypothetical protein
VFSEIFSEFTLGKVQDLNSELLLPLFKGKNGKLESENEFGGWEEKNSDFNLFVFLEPIGL